MLILVFSIESQLYAVRQKLVERCIWAMTPQPLPKDSPYLVGAINLHGSIIPLFNLRVILGLPNRDLQTPDHFVICRVQGQRFALWVDAVKAIKDLSEQDCLSAKDFFPDRSLVESVLKQDDKIVPLIDLVKLLNNSKFLTEKVV